MSEPQSDSDKLSRAFAARHQSRGTPAQCPDPQALFDAVSNTLEREQQLSIVDHVSRCAECSQAWRLAMELGARPAKPSQRPFSSGAQRFALAASILCAIGVAAYLGITIREQPPDYRDAANIDAPVSQVAGNLPRDRFVLRWSPSPQGSTYTLRLTTADLQLLLLKQDITSPELTVPSAVLKDVKSGEQLLWQVEAQLPNEERIASETYVVTLD